MGPKEIVKLGDASVAIEALPMKDLWDVLDLYKKFWDANGNLFEPEARGVAIEILSRGLRKSVEDLARMPMTLKDVQSALLSIGRVCGLELAPAGSDTGEAKAAEPLTPASDSAASTPPSPLH